MDLSERLLENTIGYLYKISEALPKNLSIPKSYYASKSRILELKGNVTLPPKITKDKVRCPRCCLNFIDYPPNTQLKCKTKQNRFHKKMLKRLEEGYKLTSFQQKYKKQLSKISDKNTMIKTCIFCQKEIVSTVNFPVTTTNISTVPLRQPKKKKKDKFAGLNPSAFISLDETPVKKSVLQVLNDTKSKQNDSKNKIQCNGDTNKKKKIKAKKLNEQIVVKSTKTKIMEKKERKEDLKHKNKIQNLLSGSTKSKASNLLSNFLETL